MSRKFSYYFFLDLKPRRHCSDKQRRNDFFLFGLCKSNLLIVCRFKRRGTDENELWEIDWMIFGYEAHIEGCLELVNDLRYRKIVENQEQHRIHLKDGKICAPREKLEHN